MFRAQDESCMFPQCYEKVTGILSMTNGKACVKKVSDDFPDPVQLPDKK